MTTLQPPDYCLLFVDSWATCMQKSEWASWAQAFFSVLGIVTAVWVVHRQHSLERKRGAQDQAARDERLLLVAMHCIETAQRLVLNVGQKRQGPGLETAAERRRQLGELLALKVQVDSLPLIELPTATSITYVSRLSIVIQQAEGLIRSTSTDAQIDGAQLVKCNQEYAAPWLPLRGELGDLQAYVEWEIARLSDPDVPHPTE